MAGQIRFFKRNKFDFLNGGSQELPSGQSNVLLDRRNTTYAVDVNSSPSFQVTLGGGNTPINRIFVLNHNIPAAEVDVGYINGATLTPIIQNGAASLSVPTATIVTENGNSFITLPETTVEKIVVTAPGSPAPTSGSIYRMAQLIGTQELGQLQGYPIISDNQFDQNTTVSRAASGRSFVQKNVGGYRMRLSVTVWNIEQDLALIEQLYLQKQGFLVWVNAGLTSQFSNPVTGFRFQDLYYMNTANEFRPQKYRGLYKSGYQIAIDLVEALF